MDEKKDLTALSELRSEDPTTETSIGDGFAVTEDAAASSSLEGLDLLESDAPMAPLELAESSSEILSEDSTKEFDPLADLAPIDREIEELARAAPPLQDSSTFEPEFDSPPLAADLEFASQDEVLDQAPTSLTPLENKEEEAPVGSPLPAVPTEAAPTQGLDFENRTSALSHEEYSPSDPTPESSRPLEERFPAAAYAKREQRTERSGVDGIRDYSDHVAPMASTVDHPFSLLIDGPLREHEREALLQILSRENLNIREVELEPQFQAGKILIPRISEYAGVLIAQALRNSNARMRLGPSDRIFASRNAEENEEEALIFPPQTDAEILVMENGSHPSDRVILSPDASLGDRAILETIDTLHCSMNLKAAQVAQPQSPAFQDALERLKRQLKLQAHHRGANALLSFKYELFPLEGQTVHKLVVQAKAVKV